MYLVPVGEKLYEFVGLLLYLCGCLQLIDLRGPRGQVAAAAPQAEARGGGGGAQA